MDSTSVPGKTYIEIWYTEAWPNGDSDTVKGRLDLTTGELTCECSLEGYTQKGRREDSLPNTLEERQQSEYWVGDDESLREQHMDEDLERIRQDFIV